MIPKSVKAIESRMRVLVSDFPNESDKVLHYEYINRHCGRLCERCFKILTDPETPSQDTTLRRLRTIKSERRNSQKNLLI